MNSPVVIHRAAWVLPISEPIIRDGAVAVLGGKILALGPFDQLKQRFSGVEVLHHGACVLMPPLINAHVHLELSHIAFLGREQPPASFTSWVERLIKERGRHPFSEEEILEKGREVLRNLYNQGVSGLGDTGNLLASASIGADFPGRSLFFHEHLGFSPQAAERELQAAQGEGVEGNCTPHAPYSCNSLLIKGLKERAQRNNTLISIHVAETEAENRFIRHGDGPFRDFLEKLGAMDPTFRAEAIDNCGAMRYLNQHGILDQGTICVHCVHVNDMEIQYIADSGAKVCLCPGSNRF
ncbi:MAG: amidohydrolase family protein, partial [Desulfobulbaceae bacterium]|nr:amidohydrolase family protein [Desulfobulbaceae bacterium]